MDRPDRATLAAYLRGALPAGRFAEVDAWLAAQGDAAADLLDEAASPLPHLTLATNEPGFIADPCRLEPGEAVGQGGMAVVHRAADRVLDRTVALKVLKARGADEPLDAYRLRQLAFRREAAITASLEHPAIPPVHAVGHCDGRPAFTMRLVDGLTLDRAVAAAPSLALVEPFLRAVEAVAAAHARGIVHRDLTPANILVGGFGSVQVLDWGLAERQGLGKGSRVGTPGWMAPEQSAGAAADPRMDVWALGGLLALVAGERPPRALAALIARCRADDPSGRYADAGQVAAELRRFLDDGLTLAQQAGPLVRGWMRLRRSRSLRGALVAAGLCIALGAWWLMHQRGLALADAADRAARIVAAADPDRPEALDFAERELALLLRTHPAHPEVQRAATRIAAVRDLHALQVRHAGDARRLQALLQRTRRHGPWPGELQDWRGALAAFAVPLEPAAAEVAWEAGPQAAAVAEALVWTWRCAVELGHEAVAARAVALLGRSLDPGMRALARVCAAAGRAAHDPVAPPGPDLDAALADAASAALVMAVFAADAAIAARAQALLAARPASFWPLVAAARGALTAGDAAVVERLALIASGAEPESMHPPLLLAYAALLRDDRPAIASATADGLRINSDHAELLGLQALVDWRAGRQAAAQAIIERLGPGHLAYHRTHRVGHAMERTVDALVASGAALPGADPALGPLAPGPHHHH